MTAPSRTQRLRAAVRAVDRWLYRDRPWWLWPSVLVFLGSVATGASLLFYPSPNGDEWTWVFGAQFGETCGMIKAVGEPCPQCGMTRSWTWFMRGHVLKAWWYNPGGVTLLLWLQAGGFVGAVRLFRQDPSAARIPHRLLAAWAMFWMFFLYLLPWVGRVFFDVNPLPGG